MKKWLPTASLLGMLAFSPCHAGDGAEKKFAELHGTWTLMKMEIEGKSFLGKDDRWPDLIIKDGNVGFGADDAPRAASWPLAKVVDPTKKPKTVTVPWGEDVTFYGIYVVDGDELRVCGNGVDTALEKNPEALRPKEFDSTKGVLLVFKRQKQ
jgi:uncharacterized protein (TIGR03067 family)